MYRAADLILPTGTGDMAAGDLTATLAPVLYDERASDAAVEQLYRKARRDSASALANCIPDLDDDAIVESVYDLWDRACCELVCRAVRSQMQLLARELSDAPSGDPGLAQRVERSQMRRVDAMITALASHALEAGVRVSGHTPESITEAAKAFSLKLAEGTPSVTPSRFGYGEVTALDPARPPLRSYWVPTMRARRIINAVIRMPDLDVFSAVRTQATSAIDRTDQALSETLDLVESDITRKILTDLDGTDRPVSALDLEQIAAGAGVTGWARRVATRVAVSKRRDVRERRFRAGAATFEPISDRDVMLRDEMAATSAAEAESRSDWLAEEERLDARLGGELPVEEASEAADVVRQAASPIERTIIGAYELHRVFRIPRLVTPADPAARERLRAALAEDAALAAKSLKAHHDRLMDAATRDQEWLPTDAVDLWLEFDAHHANELLGRSPEVIEVVANAAALPSPTLRAGTLAAFTSLLLDASGAPDWAVHAEKLTNAWKAYSSRTAPSKVSGERLRAALAAAREVPGSPIPGTDDDAIDWFRTLAIAALVRTRTQRVPGASREQLMTR